MALVSPNMGLKVWNNDDDTFESSILADNFAKLDFHDHSPGRGQQIPTEGFKDLAISSAKLGNTATVKAVGCFGANYSAAPASIATGSELIYGTELWDVSSWYNTGTGRFTPLIAGYYRFNATFVTDTDLTANQFFQISLCLNGTAYVTGPDFVTGGTTATNIRVGVNGIVPCNGTTDYVSIKTASTASVGSIGGAAESYFQGHLVGRS